MIAQEPSQTNLLYALERDGDEFRAAFYAQNGAPNHLVPEWHDVDRAEFYNLADTYAGHIGYADIGCTGVIQFYDLKSQLQEDVCFVYLYNLGRFSPRKPEVAMSYTVTCPRFPSIFTTKVETLSRAAEIKWIHWPRNQQVSPNEISVLDEDGYIIPETELLRAYVLDQ